MRALFATLLLSVLLTGCGDTGEQRRPHWVYVATSGETLTRDGDIDQGGPRVEAARRSGAHDLHCPLEGIQARVIYGRPIHVAVDGCGERIVYAEEYAYETRTYAFVAVSRFRP